MQNLQLHLVVQSPIRGVESQRGTDPSFQIVLSIFLGSLLVETLISHVSPKFHNCIYEPRSIKYRLWQDFHGYISLRKFKNSLTETLQMVQRMILVTSMGNHSSPREHFVSNVKSPFWGLLECQMPNKRLPIVFIHNLKIQGTKLCSDIQIFRIY